MKERTPLLQVEEFSGGYVDGIDIIHEVALDLYQDEILTIIGPNGAGKSTLLKAIVGALPFERGRRLFQGEDVSGWSTPRMIASGVGYVPQVDNVFTSMSIRENLEMGGYMRKTGLQGRIAEVLAMFPDLEGRPRERASRLSGGQRQMLAMARALMLDPVMLCLDEPTAALSPAARGELLARIYNIHMSGVGILMVEQNATEALVWSDRAVVMVDGDKALEGTGLDMLTSADVGRAFLGQGDGEGFTIEEGGLT
ncbi:MAG: ATP-binding cassette domain-containing protein [Chloroflexi bacterium]|nr:ATP-binding cassette domain-containing protein [Chloroflexota bacterium]